MLLSPPPDAATGIDDAMVRHVRTTLDNAAASHGVRILYAAESGTRAWGFGSPDSDYDVRFIYAHLASWYVSLTEKRDVIERPLDEHLVDLAGWDVRKALRLLLKSSPALYEWLVSPIVYHDNGAFRGAARSLFEAHASPHALAAHYWSIARGQWAREIDGRDQVKLKKYFYVVRPLLSLLHVIAHKKPPPMGIGDLLAGADLDIPLRQAVTELLVVKRATPELGLGDRIAAIDDWALAAITRLAPERLALPDAPLGHDSRDDADRLLRQVIGLERLDVL